MNPEDGTVKGHDRRSMLKTIGGSAVALLIHAVVGWRSAAHGADHFNWVLPAIPRRPRPRTLSPAVFEGKAAEAYRIAREVPELIEQMSCYCGCNKSHNHQNNLDCYVDRHAYG